MTENNQQATSVAARPEKAVVVDTGQFSNLMDTARFEHIQRVGTMYANSNMVPDHFKGKQADCVIAVEMALRLGLHPFSLMQSIYVVHGKPGMEAKLVIALINASGLFVGPLQFKLEGEGMKRQCTAYAIDKASGQMCEAVCTMEMAKAEGWIDKSGSKWKTIPDMMLQYRSGSFFGRLYAPQVLFGMQTKEELDDIEIKDVTPERETARPRSTLKDKLGATKQPVQEAEVVAEGVHATESEHAAVTAAMVRVVNAAAVEASPAVADAPKAVAAPSTPPPVPFKDLLSYAKKAKSKDQGDVVLDSLNSDGYTEAEKDEIRTILNSKAYHNE